MTRYDDVTVVIPAYKAMHTIGRAVRSVLAQPRVSSRLIVVEDGICDETQDVVSQFGDRVELLTNPRTAGAPVARNLGLGRVATPYVLFLDADDYMEDELLLGLREALERTGASVALGPVEKRTGRRRTRKTIFYPPADEKPLDLVDRWLSGNSGPNPSAIMWRTDEIRRIGGWNTAYLRNQDGELIIRAMLNGCTVAASQAGRAVYWQHRGERVSSVFTAEAFECQESLDKYVSHWCQINSCADSLKRSLNAFRFTVAQQAYLHRANDIGRHWESRWTLSGGKLSEIPRRSPGTTFKLLLVRAFGLRWGCRAYARLRWLRGRVESIL